MSRLTQKEIRSSINKSFNKEQARALGLLLEYFDGKGNLNSRVDLESEIKKKLHDIGIPSDLLGFNYLVEAIRIKMESAENVTTIYRQIADKYNITYHAVGRDISYAIKKAWDERNEEVWSKLFGTNNRVPKNRLFIAKIAIR